MHECSEIAMFKLAFPCDIMSSYLNKISMRDHPVRDCDVRTRGSGGGGQNDFFNMEILLFVYFFAQNDGF